MLAPVLSPRASPNEGAAAGAEGDAATATVLLQSTHRLVKNKAILARDCGSLDKLSEAAVVAIETED